MIPTPARAPYPPPVVRATRRFSFALLTSVALSFLPLPWGLAGLPFSLAALVLGVIAMVVMRVGASPSLWALVGVGTLVSGSLVLNYTAAVVLYDELVAYQACTQDAITITAGVRCSDEFEAAATARLHEVGASLSRILGGRP